MTSAQRRNVIVLAAVLLVGMLAIAGFGKAMGGDSYSCGELIDAMHAGAYEDTGRPPTKGALEFAYNSRACTGETVETDLSEDEIMELIK